MKLLLCAKMSPFIYSFTFKSKQRKKQNVLVLDDNQYYRLFVCVNVFFKKKGLLVYETSSVVSSRNENDENTEIFQMKFLDRKKTWVKYLCVCVCSVCCL